jgi:GntR family transcriptional regulator
MSFDFNPSRPIYQQIVQEIKTRTIRGTYPVGGKLPSVRDLASEMGVNPNTMARAYTELEREGFLITRRGEGSFVVDDQNRIDDERASLLEAAVQRFAVEVNELGLTAEQNDGLVQVIREVLSDG